MLKEKLRQKVLSCMRRQSESLRRRKSEKIQRQLLGSVLYRKAKIILCYVAFDGEVETVPILLKALADGKRVAVPALRKRSHRLIAAEIKNTDVDLRRESHFGIPQPTAAHRKAISPEELDFIIVPGIAFDRMGNRLGRGRGYFDRFLEKIPSRVPRVGLAFRFQIVRRLLIESHDQPVRRVFTD